MNPNISKQTFTFTSGIACYGNIADALERFMPHKSTAIFEEKTYYELTEPDGCLRKCMEEHFESSSQSFTNEPLMPTGVSEKLKEKIRNASVIFSDLYPNRVVFDKVEKIEIKKIIEDVLQKRDKSSHPLVFVLDCATTLFIHDEIQELLDNLSIPIEQGKLIIIATNSFAKFMGLGFDKFPGGIIQIYSSKEDRGAESLHEYIKTKSEKDAFSPEAERTFYLLLKHCSQHILSYLNIIRENTHKIYKRLEEKKLLIKENNLVADENNHTIKETPIWTEPIHVGFRCKEIPMIGFHFKWMYIQLFGLPKDEKFDEKKLNTIVIIMQYFLFAKIVEANLPITMKDSFGFPVFNIGQCWTALRATVGGGLKPEDLLKYADTISNVNDYLKDLLESPIRQKLAIKILGLTKEENFSKRICQIHATFVKSAQKGFESLIDFIISGLNNQSQF